jgi:hypothetical protein
LLWLPNLKREKKVDFDLARNADLKDVKFTIVNFLLGAFESCNYALAVDGSSFSFMAFLRIQPSTSPPPLPVALVNFFLIPEQDF